VNIPVPKIGPSVGLLVLAGLALVGVFVTYLVKSSVPGFETTLAYVLIGAAAGIAVPTPVVAAAGAAALPAAAVPVIEGLAAG
jgi:hypothetical protein